jgi:hypothetical protein
MTCEVPYRTTKASPARSSWIGSRRSFFTAPIEVVGRGGMATKKYATNGREPPFRFEPSSATTRHVTKGVPPFPLLHQALVCSLFPRVCAAHEPARWQEVRLGGSRRSRVGWEQDAGGREGGRTGWAGWIGWLGPGGRVRVRVGVRVRVPPWRLTADARVVGFFSSAPLRLCARIPRFILFAGDRMAMGLRWWTGICRPSGAWVRFGSHTHS